MKLKKYFLVTLVSICFLSFSQPAFAANQSIFADDNDFLPCGPGWYEYEHGKEEWNLHLSEAAPIYEHVFHSDYIETPDDQDWYRYTNNTGHVVVVEYLMFSPSTKNYDMIFFRQKTNDSGGYVKDKYNYGCARDSGSGKTDGMRSMTVLPGQTILWGVVSHTAIWYGGNTPNNAFSTTRNYFTWVNVSLPANK